MSREAFEAEVLAAMSAVRDGGHNLLTHLYGIEWDIIGDGEASGAITGRVQSLDHKGRFASTPTLMLADLVLGRSVRSYFGPGTPGVTSAIDVDLYAPLPAGAELVCEARQTLANGRRAAAEGWLSDNGGTRVANVRGRFVALTGARRPSDDASGRDAPKAAVSSTSGLSPTERELLDSLLARYIDAPTALGQCETLLGRRTLHPGDGGEVELRQRPEPLVQNQTGRVQGGVIAGMLFDACRDASLHDEQDWDLSTLSLRFLHAGLLEGDDLVVRGKVDQRETERGTACVSARLDQSPRSGLALATAIVARHPYGRAVSTGT